MTSNSLDWIWAFVVALVAVVFLHQPELSIQKAFGDGRAMSFGQTALLKFVAGAVTSAIILALCRGILRRPLTIGVLSSATLTQLFWLEIEWGFSIAAADTSELLVRFSEEAGTVAIVLGVFAYARLRPAHTARR